MTRIVSRRKNLEIPEETVEVFRTLSDSGVEKATVAYVKLLTDKGWTYQSISNLTKKQECRPMSRETARIYSLSMNSSEAVKIVQTVDPSILDSIPVPEQRFIEKKVKIIAEPSKEDLERLIYLKPLAAKVRYRSTTSRDAAEEYIGLLWKVHTVDGVSVYRLGKLLGILPSAIESRFVRYGYQKTKKGVSSNYDLVRPRHNHKEDQKISS